MKNLDPKYLEQRRRAKAETLDKELEQPGSVIFIGSYASGFTMYSLGALGLVAVDILIKMFG